MPLGSKLILFTYFLSSIWISLAIADEVSINNKKVLGLYESLLDAIEMDSEGEVKQFIAFGANVNYEYDEGKTPLMLASSMGSIKSVQTLIEHGANLNLKSDENMTALDYARAQNNEAIISILDTKHSPLQPQSKRQLISTIQFYLNRLGYVAGDVDGIYGSKTRNSLKQFSKDFNQKFSVEISSRQIGELYDAMLASNPEYIDKDLLTEMIPKEINNEFDISNTQVVTEFEPPINNLDTHSDD